MQIKMSVESKEYSKYLKSQHWKKLKIETKRRLKREGKLNCYTCKYDKRLHLHHRTYKRLYQELPEDLVCLCKRCHFRLHRLVREGKSNLYNAHIYLRNKLGIVKPKITDKPAVCIVTIVPEIKFDHFGYRAE